MDHLPKESPLSLQASQPVRVAINSGLLAKMIARRQLYLSDLQCLDCDSKQCLWRLCLAACADDLKS